MGLVYGIGYRVCGLQGMFSSSYRVLTTGSVSFLAVHLDT